VLENALIVIGGYLVGSIPSGVVVVRLLRGEDIRAQGSGNIGASNVWRQYGRWLGVPVALLDVAKGFVPALLGLKIGGEWVGVLTGSAAMLAETVHSLADTANEILLYVGLRRSRPEPDASHPFGYGQERWFWSFLAALGIFLVGGVLAIAEGIRSLLKPEPLESFLVGLGVLLVSFVLEAISWRNAYKEVRCVICVGRPMPHAALPLRRRLGDSADRSSRRPPRRPLPRYG